MRAQFHASSSSQKVLELHVTKKAGLRMSAGMRVFLYDRVSWEKMQKRERIEPVSHDLSFTQCAAFYCTASGELEEKFANAILAESVAGGAWIGAMAVAPSGQQIRFDIPLNGLAAASTGQPVKRPVAGARGVSFDFFERRRVSISGPLNTWAKTCDMVPVYGAPNSSAATAGEGSKNQSARARRQLCLTQHLLTANRVPAPSKGFVGSAAIHEMEGDAPWIMIRVPVLADIVDIRKGGSVAVQKQDRALKGGTGKPRQGAAAQEALKYSVCDMSACALAGPAASLLEPMKAGGTLIVTFFDSSKKPLKIEFPLAGFNEAISVSTSK